MLATCTTDYTAGEDLTFRGHMAFDTATPGPRPGVLVLPTWKGVDDFARAQAAALAPHGWVGFVADMYGDGRVPEADAEALDLMDGLKAERGRLRRRVGAALDALAGQPEVDETRLAAIGFCFGGLCVLELARSGAPVKGVASFHGFFDTTAPYRPEDVQAKILAFHGSEDPLVPWSQVEDFRREMADGGLDWELVIFGGAKHGFMNPAANAPDHGVLYDASVAARARARLEAFLGGLFEA